jgi:hypothetical protein
MKTLKIAVLTIISTVLATILVACASAPSKAPPAAAAPAAKTGAGVNLTGTWDLTVDTPMGARNMKLNATQTGETLTGAIASPRGEVPITGTVKGNAVAFMMKLNAQGMDMQIDYAGTVEGDSMKGTAKFGDMGNGTFTGKKQ